MVQMDIMDFLAANLVRIIRLCGQDKAHCAVIFAIARLCCIIVNFSVVVSDKSGTILDQYANQNNGCTIYLVFFALAVIRITESA